MTDDNKEFQQQNEDFNFDDDMNEFIDETHDVSDAAGDSSSEAAATKTSRFKNKFSGLGGKFKVPKFGDKLSGKLPGKLKNRRILIGIVFVVLVIFIYLYLSSGSSSTSPVVPMNASIQHIATMPPANEFQQVNNTTGSVAKPAGFAVSGLNPAQETKPMVMPAPAKPAPPVNIADEFAVKPQNSSATPPVVSGISKMQLTAALDDLSTHLQTVSDKQMQMIANKMYAQYTELTAQNQALTNQINNLQQQMADLKSSVATSHNNIKTLQGKISDIVNGYAGSFNASGTAVYHNVPKPQIVPAAVNAVTYVVQAIVPGRAWLYGSNNQTVSVGVGDKIEGYGNVINIDSLAGTVTMSNGAVLNPGA